MGPTSLIEQALRSLAAGAAAPRRAEVAERLAACVVAEGAPGWSGAEWAEHLREELPDAPELPPRVEGVVLVAPHASELALAPLARVLAHLERGERVLLAVPEEIPALMGVWKTALGEVPGCAFVQDDGLGVLRAALAHPLVASFEASGPPARVAELAQRAPGCFTTLRNTSLVVRRGDDAEQQARVAARRAFGRVSALSGQRAGALGRVVCHERSFSRFQAALLAALEQDADFAQALPLLERATRAHLLAARSLGLDEGATLVLHRRESGACVFTNVDERMRLAALARCAPLLVLLRATSDEAAAALAEQLDSDARAEDLAASA